MQSIYRNNSTNLFEKLARDTWERIRLGESYNCSQGEETLTDINLLDILLLSSPRDIRVKKATKALEARCGIDWEWWIGSNRQPGFRGWWRYAVQAKKINKSRSYSKLRHKVGNQDQFELLEAYAEANHCIPLYCFYNFTEKDTQRYWHCCQTYNQTQMGCTIAPLDAVRPLFKKYASKKFSKLHRDERVLPWRCLTCCPKLLPQGGSHPLFNPDFFNYDIEPNDLPDFLLNDDPDNNEILEFPINFYNRDIVEVYPKRIVIIEVPDVGIRG